MYEARAETPCHATESADKVRRAVLNIFPEAQLEGGNEEGIAGHGGTLNRFAELLRRQRIRDSAREVLEGGIQGNRLVFYLNKQAAYAGRVSFSAHAPLGDICVTVVSDDLRGLVRELTSSTRAGGGESRAAAGTK
ncbi:MAG: RNA-binding domain-containing protein [Thermoplasmata archaeon]